jgi:anti-anti-sigma factor
MVRSTTIHQLRIGRPALDTVAAAQLLRGAKAACTAGACALVIDLTGVERVDPEGLSALLSLREPLLGGVRVVLASMSPETQKLAWITHIHDVFDIYSDARAAILDLSI